MKIKQLIKKLQRLNGELEVILSSDAEGNSFKTLDFVYPLKKKELFDSEFGEVIELELQKGDTYDKKHFTKAVILFPR